MGVSMGTVLFDTFCPGVNVPVETVLLDYTG